MTALRRWPDARINRMTIGYPEVAPEIPTGVYRRSTHNAAVNGTVRPVRRGQPPRRPRADDRSGRLGRCDRPSDVRSTTTSRTAFLEPVSPERSERGTADPRPAPDRPAVAQTMPSSGTHPRSRCRSAMSKATPTPLTSGRGRRRASSTQRPMRRVESPHRTGPRIVVGRVDD